MVYNQNVNTSAGNKQIAKNTIFLYLRSLLLLLISLYTSRITLQVLGVEDFGIYQIVGGVVAMFSMLSSSLTSASQRFITFTLGKNNLEELKQVFSTCITLHICLGFIVVILLEFIGIWFLNNKLNIPADRLITARWVMQFSIATFFVSVISIPYNAVIIAHEKMSAFAYIGILEGLLKLGSVILLIFANYKDKLLLYSIFYFVISLFLRFVYTIYSKKHFEETNRLKLGVNKMCFREMFAFAGWNLIGNGSLVLRNQGVDIILNLFFGVVVNAAKGISNQVNSAVTQLVGNFTTAMKPQLTKAIAQKDYQRTYSLINCGSRYSFILMLIFAVPIFITTPQLLELWLGEVPTFSVEFVRWTMIYLLLDSLSRMMIHAILSHGQIKEYQIVAGGTKLLAIPLVWFFLQIDVNPLWGIWVNIILELMCLIERLYYSNKLLSFDYKSFCKKVVLVCVLLSFFAYSISALFVYYVTDDFLASIIVSVFITLLSIWFIGTNSREHAMIIQFVKKKIKR